MSYILENVPTCKNCGAEEKRIVLDYKHINGKRKEIVEYECGLVIEYIPNFSKMHMAKPCTHTAEYAQMKLNEKQLYIKLVATVERAQVTNEYKKSVLKWLSYARR